jgi:thiamine biosynthesis lipoprotein
MQLDLGGVAKGYACDEAQRVLRENGVTLALFEAGGDIAVSGAPPGERGWQVDIAAGTSGRLTLVHAAVSSSGDTEQYVEIGGRRYSHIVDPRTGLGLTDRVAVTVVAPRGITSDSLATAISVLGRVAGMRLAAGFPGVTAFIRPAAP